MINGDAFKLAFGERKFLIFHPYPEILAINHFYTMTLHKKELSALENHLTSSIPQCVVVAQRYTMFTIGSLNQRCLIFTVKKVNR